MNNQSICIGVDTKGDKAVVPLLDLFSWSFSICGVREDSLKLCAHLLNEILKHDFIKVDNFEYKAKVVFIGFGVNKYVELFNDPRIEFVDLINDAGDICSLKCHDVIRKTLDRSIGDSLDFKIIVFDKPEMVMPFNVYGYEANHNSKMLKILYREYIRTARRRLSTSIHLIRSPNLLCPSVFRELHTHFIFKLKYHLDFVPFRSRWIESHRLEISHAPKGIYFIDSNRLREVNHKVLTL